MGRLPVTVVSPHVRTSKGASADSLKFYSTNYATAYGDEDFTIRHGHHSGAGYNSNLRPTICYNPSLDRMDNPTMAFLLRDNYNSITTKHFRPLQVPVGNEPLPWSVHQTDSAFVRCDGLHVPCTRMVKRTFVNTQDHGSQNLVGLPGKHRPLLFQNQGKGTEEMENCRYGPSFMSTEYKARFASQPSCIQGRFRRKDIGTKENSGYTEGSPLEPITYCPKMQYRQDIPVGDPSRTYGESITKSHFLPSTGQKGNEALPAVAPCSVHDTGFTRETYRHEQLEAAEELPRSVTKHTFTGRQRPSPTVTDLLQRVDCGNKELTGFSLNNKMYVASGTAPNHPEPYMTSYNQRFHDRTPIGLDREGWTRGGIQTVLPDGFSINNVARKLANYPDSTETLRKLHPHVARTIRVADPFYDDHTDERHHYAIKIGC